MQATDGEDLTTLQSWAILRTSTSGFSIDFDAVKITPQSAITGVTSYVVDAAWSRRSIF